MIKNKLVAWFSSLNSKIWILAAGRLLSQIGTGFTLFYAPIFFVDQVGLSATQVGLGLGSASISGVIGRFLGGSFSDSKFWGRRRTLLLSAVISAFAAFFLSLAFDFSTLLIGNLLMGLGIGLYWPATEATVADLSTPDKRNEAFAVTRLADSLGLGIGVILGGLLIANDGNYRALFIIDGISFLVFLVLIYWKIPETNQLDGQKPSHQPWLVAFRDRYLMIYVVVNILFTTYIAQIQSTMPLYFKNFGNLSAEVISAIFSFHVVLAAICQLPIARFLNRFTRPRALIVSLLFWFVGFIFVFLTGIVRDYALIYAVLALTILAIALDAYNPSASALVVDIAPPSLRGVYLAINSQCWAIGYLIGPPAGGWALDQSKDVANIFWLVMAASTIIGILILQYLDQKKLS